jgi:tetratricopeptide (TPR) repeat protein
VKRLEHAKTCDVPHYGPVGPVLPPERQMSYSGGCVTLSRTRLVAALVAGVLAVGMLLAGAVLGSPDEVADRAAAPSAEAAAPGTIEALQARLADVPGDYPGWATLGQLYVDRARTTADPSWYAKAEQALDRSLEEQPEDNALALTGMASLHASRHDFAAAESTARQALAVNEFDATAYGVLTDALTELGRYDEAAEALQRMADLDPGFAALTRISYARELRGDVPGAKAAMQSALDSAGTGADAGFALLHLGELAWSYDGDPAAAEAFFSQGLGRDPESLPLQAAAARAAAAQGRTDEALAAYEGVTARVPVQQYLVEHAELLAAAGREDEAAAQLELVRTSITLLDASGSVVDLETALFEADHGTAEAALAAAQAAYDARPGNVFAADALAWALHAAGRSAEALPLADQALSLGVRPASFLFHRGMIAEAAGRPDEARRSLTEALEVNPHFSVAQAATAREALARLGG